MLARNAPASAPNVSPPTDRVRSRNHLRHRSAVTFFVAPFASLALVSLSALVALWTTGSVSSTHANVAVWLCLAFGAHTTAFLLLSAFSVLVGVVIGTSGSGEPQPLRTVKRPGGLHVVK